MAMLGIYSYQKLPIDAVPDITNVQVQINTRATGLFASGSGTARDLSHRDHHGGSPQPPLHPFAFTLRAIAGHRYFQ